MNRKLTFPLLAVMLALGGAAVAGEQKDPSVGQALNDARLEGQLFATYTLNTHLNPFDIDVDVKGDTAVLTGKVEDAVQKDLAEQIALGTDGIENVDNRIEVVSDIQVSKRSADDERGFGDRVGDATTTATVKSKLLWNRNTGGMGINVTTRSGVVTLEGDVDSEASKELAEMLAANTDDVMKVDNRLVVKPEQESDSERGLGETVSDGWITTKVKSTLLFSQSVSGSSINVDTKEGVVSLKGRVATSAERDLAVKLTEDVRGVARVDASGLEVTG